MAACGVLLGGLLLSTNANATVTYRDSASVQFTFAPMLSVSLSADGFTINDLVPGTSSISNAVTATVITNSNHGYQLSATVGNSTYTSSDLVSSTGNKRFSMISSGTSLTSGTWGYTLDSGTTYGGLSTYIPTLLKTTAGPTGDLGDATAMQIGAYATADQKPDVYNNVVNFIVLSNIEPPELTPYEMLVNGQLSMQAIGNLDADKKTTLLSQMTTGTSYNTFDTRDNEVYKISKLEDGKIWLQDNLRLGSATLIQSLSTDNTNMSSSVPFELPTSISSGYGSYTTAQINADYANTTVTSYGAGSGNVGVYYNYCAATAGTYCMGSGSGSGDASYDVCPKGWKIPTTGSGGEYQALFTAYSSDGDAFRAALSIPLSGHFYGSAPDGQNSYTNFWSSTYRDNKSVYGPFVNSSTIDLVRNNNRDYGRSVRCLLK